MPQVSNAHTGTTNEKRSQFKAAKILEDELPNWAKTMTPGEAAAYVDSQVTDLASTKVVMQQMAKVLIVVVKAVLWLFRHYKPE